MRLEDQMSGSGSVLADPYRGIAQDPFEFLRIVHPFYESKRNYSRDKRGGNLGEGKGYNYLFLNELYENIGVGELSLRLEVIGRELPEGLIERLGFYYASADRLRAEFGTREVREIRIEMDLRADSYPKEARYKCAINDLGEVLVQNPSARSWQEVFMEMICRFKGVQWPTTRSLDYIFTKADGANYGNEIDLLREKIGLGAAANYAENSHYLTRALDFYMMIGSDPALFFDENSRKFLCSSEENDKRVTGVQQKLNKAISDVKTRIIGTTRGNPFRLTSDCIRDLKPFLSGNGSESKKIGDTTEVTLYHHYQIYEGNEERILRVRAIVGGKDLDEKSVLERRLERVSTLAEIASKHEGAEYRKLSFFYASTIDGTCMTGAVDVDEDGKCQERGDFIETGFSDEGKKGVFRTIDWAEAIGTIFRRFAHGDRGIASPFACNVEPYFEDPLRYIHWFLNRFSHLETNTWLDNTSRNSEGCDHINLYKVYKIKVYGVKRSLWMDLAVHGRKLEDVFSEKRFNPLKDRLSKTASGGKGSVQYRTLELRLNDETAVKLSDKNSPSYTSISTHKFKVDSHKNIPSPILTAENGSRMALDYILRQFLVGATVEELAGEKVVTRMETAATPQVAPVAKDQFADLDEIVDPLLFLQKLIQRTNLKVAYNPDHHRIDGIIGNGDFFYDCFYKMKGKEDIQVFLHYDAFQVANDHEFIRYLSGEGVDGAIPIRQFDIAKHTLADFGPFANKISIHIACYTKIKSTASNGRSYEYDESTFNAEIEPCEGRWKLDNKNINYSVSTAPKGKDLRLAKRHREKFGADELEQQAVPGDWRPYLHRMVEKYALDVSEWHNPTRYRKTAHVFAQTSKNDAVVSSEEPAVGASLEEITEREAVTVSTGYEDPLVFLQRIVPAVGLKFKDLKKEDNPDHARKGTIYRNYDLCRKRHGKQFYFDIGFLYDVDHDGVPKRPDDNVVLDLIDGKTRINYFSFDPAKQCMKDLGELADRTTLTFNYYNDVDEFNYCVAVSQKDGGWRMVEIDCQSHAKKVATEAFRNKVGIDDIETKTAIDDYRPHVHRMLELFVGTQASRRHDPAIYRPAGGVVQVVESVPTETPVMPPSIQEVLETTIESLFVGDEGDSLKEDLRRARLALGEWASIPRLNLGMVRLPTPGMKKGLQDDYLLTGGILLVENLAAMQIKTRVEAEEIVLRKLMHHYIHNEGFQLGRERAVEIIDRLKLLREEMDPERSDIVYLKI